MHHLQEMVASVLEFLRLQFFVMSPQDFSDACHGVDLQVQSNSFIYLSVRDNVAKYLQQTYYILMATQDAKNTLIVNFMSAGFKLQ